MASYSDLLRLALQATGENPSTWGNVANNGVFQLIEDAVAGVVTHTMTGGTYSLTTANGSTDEARKAIIIVNGALTTNATVEIPAKSKIYVVKNGTTGAHTLSVVIVGFVGTPVAITQGTSAVVWCDGSTCYLIGSGGGGGGGGGLLGISVVTSSGTYTTPVGATSLYVELVGAGGGGGGFTANGLTGGYGGGGGGGGGYAASTITSPVASYAVTIGTRGTGAGSGSSSSAGSATSFAGLVVANGGSAGASRTTSTGGASHSAGANGGQGVTGSLKIAGGKGGDGASVPSTITISGAGGDSMFGSGGASQLATSGFEAGDDGFGYGSGGSGSAITTTASFHGGDGADGLIRVWAFG